MNCPHCFANNISNLSGSLTHSIFKCEACSSMIYTKDNELDFSFIHQIIKDKKYLLKSFFKQNSSFLYMCPPKPTDTLILIAELDHILIDISLQTLPMQIKNIINFS